MNKKNLTRKLTPLNVWSLAFGCVIGFGAYLMPGTVFLKKAGTLGTLIAMQIGAIVMLVISYNYHYMIKRFPVSGGQFIYARMAFGKNHGFICAWFLGLCYLSMIPVNANAISILSRTLFSGAFQYEYLYTIAGNNIFLGELLLSISALIILAFIDYFGVKIAGRIQTFLVIILLGTVIFLLTSSLTNPLTKASNLYPMFVPLNENENGLSNVYNYILQALLYCSQKPRGHLHYLISMKYNRYC